METKNKKTEKKNKNKNEINHTNDKISNSKSSNKFILTKKNHMSMFDKIILWFRRHSIVVTTRLDHKLDELIDTNKKLTPEDQKEFDKFKLDYTRRLKRVNRLLAIRFFAYIMLSASIVSSIITSGVIAELSQDITRVTGIIGAGVFLIIVWITNMFIKLNTNDLLMISSKLITINSKGK